VNVSPRDQIVAAVSTFPDMSNAAMRLLQLLRDPKRSAADVEDVMRQDAGLTANILRIANSAYFGFPDEIASIRQAIVRLGWRQMRQVVLTASMNTMLEEPIDGYQLGRGELWRHALATSIAAETLVKKKEIPVEEDPFTSALLHDAGKIVMGKFVAEDFSLIELAAAEGAPFHEAERVVLDTDHAEVGALILEKWSFPASLVAAVRWHHEPGGMNPHSRLVDVVHIANETALRLGVGAGVEVSPPPLSRHAMERLELTDADVDEICRRTSDKLEDFPGAAHN